MMLPSCVPIIRHVAATTLRRRRARSVRLFLAGYLGVWTVLGMSVFAGDAWYHHIAAYSTWGDLPPALTLSATFFIAAAWQFSPVKQRCLKACRSAVFLPLDGRRADLATLQLGLRHGTSCVGSCWALMLVMFALGPAALAWMVFLTLVVLSEKSPKHTQRISRRVGLVLATVAVLGFAAPALVAAFP